MLIGNFFIRIAANPGPVVLNGPGQSEFELLDEFPRTPSGKLDRSRLDAVLASMEMTYF